MLAVSARSNAMSYTVHESAAAVVLTPSAPATSTVIWLHGLGADGYDFVPIVEELRVEGVKFVFPHAEPRPITINNGYVMRAWYDISGFALTTAEDDAGIRASASVVRALIDAEVASGIAASNIVLAGFSQGGAMALHTGLRYPERLAGILALSTYLPLRDSLPAEASDANRNVPILMCHGEQDPIVPVATGQMSRDVLGALGYRVQWQSYRMEHQVCHEEIAAIAAWLKDILKGSSRPA
jgi:phospholipase/carboxylesterase